MRRTTSTSMSYIIACVLMCGLPSTALGQQLNTFEEVRVEEVRPEDLGGGLLLEDPASLLNPVIEDAVLEISEEKREALRVRVASSVVEVVALHMPPEPYEQIPMIYRGHGVWLSGKSDGSDPVLISTLAWLQDAKEIYVVPSEPGTRDKKKKKGRKPELSAQELTLKQVASGKEAWRAFKKNKKDYIRVLPERPDRMRGLVMLTTKAKGTPAKGLTLLPADTTSLNYLFGYTHIHPELLTNARLMPTRSGLDEISFFFLNTYSATLGAPVFNERAQVVMLNALPNPKDGGTTLAIPPGALRDFVAAAQEGK